MSIKSYEDDHNEVKRHHWSDDSSLTLTPSSTPTLKLIAATIEKGANIILEKTNIAAMIAIEK